MTDTQSGLQGCGSCGNEADSYYWHQCGGRCPNCMCPPKTGDITPQPVSKEEVTDVFCEWPGCKSVAQLHIGTDQTAVCVAHETWSENGLFLEPKYADMTRPEQVAYISGLDAETIERLGGVPDDVGRSLFHALQKATATIAEMQGKLDRAKAQLREYREERNDLSEFVADQGLYTQFAKWKEARNA